MAIRTLAVRFPEEVPFDPVVLALEDVTPLIELRRPGVCAFATRGPSRYFGGDTALAKSVLARVSAVVTSGRVSTGIADGPFTALLAAHSSVGVRVVSANATVAFLAAHPVGVLSLAGVSSEMIDVLERLGLTTLGLFAALEPGDVIGRFGVEGRRAHRLARGLDEYPPAAVAPPPELTVVAVIDPPSERVDRATFIAKTLADELHTRLEQRGLACTRVRIVLETEHGERLERLWRHEGTLTTAAVVERVRWQLDGWLSGSAASRPTGGVSRLLLIPDQITPAHGRQFGLWGGRSDADVRATRAMARVQGVLSHTAVLKAQSGGGRGPAESVVLIPFVADEPDVGPTGDADPPWPGRLPSPAPGRVHVNPPCVELIDAMGAPVGVSGRGLLTAEPAQIAVGGRSWQVVEAWSAPWLFDERWWDPTRHRRRARMQVVADGTAHILNLEGGRWSVEATYD